MYLTHEPLDAASLIASVAKSSNGAVLTFIGQVRDHTNDESVTHLDYEAYEPMAERVLKEIIEVTKSRYPDINVSLKHRLGRLELTDMAVVIAVGSPHRADAFDACRAIIETLKTDVPIFKKEFRGNGSVWVGMGS
ncbi:MAG: molybdenum cofactor biosynthesis protein MoaE [Bradymonadia bacterium]